MKLANGLQAIGLERFLRNDASKGLLLIGAAAAALLMANTAWQGTYRDVLALPVPVPGKPLTLGLFINDALMAVFFLLVGMELKRELVAGELRSRDRVMLPALAALGGMIAPALVFAWFNRGNPSALAGWAIPCATDIAFALGILALLGNRVPTGLKVFLTALAVLDDLGAIVIIAIFYTAALQPWYLLAALGVIVVMWLANRRGVTRMPVYMLLGLALWWLTLKSGVHATLAGVATAMVIPLKDRTGRKVLEHFEHQLAPWVNFAILPVFALANAGVFFADLGDEGLASGASTGTAAGLVVGKLVGVFGAAWLTVRLGLGKLPAAATWRGIFGVACLCGIGFTMSIFIAELAYTSPGSIDASKRVVGAIDGGAATLLNQSKAGILLGSLVSAIFGLAVLFATLPQRRAAPADMPID